MGTSGFSPSDRAELEAIVEDLETVFERNQIELDELDDLGLQSRLVYEYLDDLRRGSKPESALRDKLVTSASVLARSIFGRMSPEIGIKKES